MAGEWKGKDKSLDHSPAQRFEARPMTGKCDGSVTSLRDPTSDTLLALPPPWHSDTPPTECHTPPQRRHTHFHAHPTVTNLQGEKVCEYCMPLLLIEMYSFYRNMFGMYRKSTLSEKMKVCIVEYRKCVCVTAPWLEKRSAGQLQGKAGKSASRQIKRGRCLSVSWSANAGNRLHSILCLHSIHWKLAFSLGPAFIHSQIPYYFHFEKAS